MKNLLLVALCCALLSHVSASADPICHGDKANFELVTISSGTIRGVTCPNLGFSVFKGVPYAASTAGENRWRAPQSVTPWTGIRDTLNYAPSCPQPTNFLTPVDSFSEDCLNINIWTPSLTSNITYPVMVWIYGGGFIYGSANIPAYTGDFLANTSNIVLVAVNYRLGPLGFLNGGNLTGNYGFLDQQAALQWVQINIHAFNGDAKRVTIAGQSAGAMSVGAHMISPSSKGLFQRAIMESNPYGIALRTAENFEKSISSTLASYVGCNITDLVCLRAVDVNTLVSHTMDVAPLTFPFSSSSMLIWNLIIDGMIIPDQPLHMIGQGQFLKDIPVLIGNTKNESVGFFENAALQGLLDWEYDIFVDTWFGGNAAKVISMFPAEGSHSIAPFRHLFTAYMFVCPTRYAANSIANLGAGAFWYQVFHIPSHDIANPYTDCTTTAVCHASELPYVFGSYSFAKEGMTPDEEKLSTQFMKYWAEFIHGAPVNAPLQPASSYPAWQPLDNSTYPSLVFDIPLTTNIGYQANICDVFDTWGYVY